MGEEVEFVAQMAAICSLVLVCAQQPNLLVSLMRLRCKLGAELARCDAHRLIARVQDRARSRPAGELIGMRLLFAAFTAS